MPFACAPNRGVIPPEESRDVVCQFQADHSFEHFRADAVCEYGGAGCSVRIRFSGSAWGAGIYARLPGALKLSDPVAVTGGVLARSSDVQLPSPQ